MNNIQTFKFNTKDITCYVVNGDPYFRGKDVASILGCTQPGPAIRDHVPENCKHTYESLMSSVGRIETMRLDHNDKTTLYINEEAWCIYH